MRRAKRALPVIPVSISPALTNLDQSAEHRDTIGFAGGVNSKAPRAGTGAVRGFRALGICEALPSALADLEIISGEDARGVLTGVANHDYRPLTNARSGPPSALWIWMPQEPSDAQLDALILVSAQRNWITVEMVVVRVGDLCADGELRFDPDAVASRITALVRGARLEATGDLSRWQHGEVRLPGPANEI
jgi:hypothetical protein